MSASKMVLEKASLSLDDMFSLDCQNGNESQRDGQDQGNLVRRESDFFEGFEETLRAVG